MEEQKIELKIINMADIQSQEIEWLWYPFIPYGKLTITIRRVMGMISSDILQQL